MEKHLNRFRRSLTWLAHCYKAVFNNYHQQLLPLCSIILKKNDLVIDVGAHAGQLSKIFYRYVPRGRVLAIEPGRYPLSILHVVIFLHRIRTITIIAKGVGRQEGKAILQTPVKNSGVLRFGLSHISTNETEANNAAVRNELVEITTIDALVTQYGRELRFALLKADIEGQEYEMLCGAVHSIEKDKPCLLLEISNDRNKIMNFLWQREYVIFNLLNYGGKKTERLHLDKIQNKSGNDARNILAVHKYNEDILEKIQTNFCK